MANIERLIPFIIKWESGTTRKAGEDNAALFGRARSTGWSDDPADAGGKTMVGVTLKTFQAYCRKKGQPEADATALRNINYTTWRDVLKTLYWNKWRADEIRSQSVAEILVDWVWGSGSAGVIIPQSKLGVDADGIVGDKTIAAVNAQSPQEFFNLMKLERGKYFDRICQTRPSNLKFKKGWLNRLNDLQFKE